MTTLLSVADGAVATPLNSPSRGRQRGQAHGEDVARQSIGGGGFVGKEGGERPQHQGPGPPVDQHRASSAGARANDAADRSTASPLRTQRCRPRPRQSPSSPPPAYLYPGTTTAGAGAGARAGSLRPSVSGILAGNFGDSPQHRHERAASVGDRYKGNHNIGVVQRQRQKQQRQQQLHDCSSTGNRVYRAGDQSAERFGELVGSATHSSREPRRGPNTVRGPYSAVSDALGADGPAAPMSAAGVETGDRGGGTGASSRRRSGREDASRVEVSGRDGDEEGSKGREGDRGQQDGQQGHGRVAQIAEGLLWVQKHPVLAAVIWMCGKVLDPGSEDNQQETNTVEGASKAAAEDRHVDYEYEDSSDPVPGMTGDFEEGRIVPPGFWRRHSKGRLSWSDDYQGGCLAEYYEDERARMASEASSVDADASGQQQQQQHHSQQRQQHQQGQQQVSPSAFKLTAATTAATTSCRRCDVGSRQYSHGHGGQVTAPTSRRTSTSVGRAECSGCKQSSGNCGGAARARGGAGSNTRAARGGVVRVTPSGQARGEEANKGNYEGNDHNDYNGSNDDDEEDEVFHSALQLAVGGDCGHGDDTEDADDLAGFFGGCGPRGVQHDKFDGVTRDSMEGEGHRECVGGPGSREREPAVGADSPEGGRISTSCKQTGEVTGVSGPNGAGTPNSGAGAGTWSPQWGWYVTMTPPQEQYPAQHNPFPGVKPPTPTTTAESSDTPTSLEGRPPRP